MNKPYFCRNCFLTDWRHKRLKNKIDLLLKLPEKYFAARGYIRLDTKKEWESVKHYLTASKRNENKY